MKITRLEDTKIWEAIADNCAYATFFHTPLWYSIFAETYDYMTIKTQLVCFRDGKTAIFPLMEEKESVIQRNYRSGPAGVYGGWITDNDISQSQAQELTNKILSSYKNLYWRLNPIAQSSTFLGNYIGSEDSTQLLNLDAFGDEDALIKNYRHSVRKQINKGIKKGFTIKTAGSRQEWEAYYSLYLKALKRWGDYASSRYEAVLFDNIRQLNSSKVKLWLLLIDDKIIGGNLNFYHNCHCVEWHAAYDDDYFKFGSRNFLVHHLINHARETGFKYYDFNPSGGHEGTLRFKRNFGTMAAPAHIICQKDNSFIHKTLWKVVAVKNRLQQMIQS